MITIGVQIFYYSPRRGPITCWNDDNNSFWTVASSCLKLLNKSYTKQLTPSQQQCGARQTILHPASSEQHMFSKVLLRWGRGWRHYLQQQWWIGRYRWRKMLHFLSHGLCKPFWLDSLQLTIDAAINRVRLMFTGSGQMQLQQKLLKINRVISISKISMGIISGKECQSLSGKLDGSQPCENLHGAPRSWASAVMIFWRVSACHSVACAITACCCCCCCSWKTWGIVSAEAGARVVTPPRPTIRGNCEKGEEDELTGTFVVIVQ